MRGAMSDAINNAIDIAIDKVGRLVIPKEIRDEAGIEPGMPLTIRCREGLQIAVSVEPGEPLTRAAVKSAQRRARREGDV
jgi:AbrB family looped-hinge helix DNA binding protein